MIEEISCYHVPWDDKDYFPAASAWLFIKDDEGRIGIGEVSPVMDGLPAIGFVQKIAASLIGKDPLNAGLIHRTLSRNYAKLGPQGIVSSALAAIDIALWDLKGKQLGQPVHQLLGGAARKAVPFYLSIGGLGPKPVDEVKAIVEAGMKYAPTMVKIRMEHPRHQRDLDVKTDLKKASLVRKIVGDDFPLAFDASNGYSRNAAYRAGETLGDLGYIWFEEPVDHLDLSSFEFLSRKLRIAIAAGEQSYTLQDLLGLINAGIGILQPDIIKMGGFTGLAECAALAAAHGCDLVPHQTQPGIGHAANLQFLAAQPDLPFPAELNDPTDRQQRIFRDPLRPIAGHFQVRDLPGIGLEVDLEEFRRRAIQVDRS
ncbi:mandelate racemase/muconate lactonizing enzyme family protein [Microvirga aerilata]|uniref:Mandelate racemase/muconate lactonizing enzyme family protein n=1 Tax=Microvirga aerilata TaxID=670292 RepID=A0A936Z9L7_9HYPH|nr:mandelate racemase/muconate lactonizing enzyme family protein [Microvirga aerilata]MBL0405506.1 mandelate racemase/muconate lactonizing enzyme family protein [Microvirga aerilata]